MQKPKSANKNMNKVYWKQKSEKVLPEQPKQEYINISKERLKSTHDAAHVDPLQQLCEFGLRRELRWLSLPAPHFDSNSPVIQKWQSSWSQEIDLQLFQFHLWNITAVPWGAAATDTEFICPFAFTGTCGVLLNQL